MKLNEFIERLKQLEEVVGNAEVIIFDKWYNRYVCAAAEIECVIVDQLHNADEVTWSNNILPEEYDQGKTVELIKIYS